MTIQRALSIAAALAIAASLIPLASADERAELKERFAERYPTLVKLKEGGLVGETYDGLAEVVKPAYASRKTGDKDSPTIATFLEAENDDRNRLYELLAAETRTTPELVARRNAKRNFEKAGPEEYLKPQPGTWVKKKDL